MSHRFQSLHAGMGCGALSAAVVLNGTPLYDWNFLPQLEAFRRQKAEGKAKGSSSQAERGGLPTLPKAPGPPLDRRPLDPATAQPVAEQPAAPAVPDPPAHSSAVAAPATPHAEGPATDPIKIGGAIPWAASTPAEGTASYEHARPPAPSSISNGPTSRASSWSRAGSLPAPPPLPPPPVHFSFRPTQPQLAAAAPQLPQDMLPPTPQLPPPPPPAFVPQLASAPAIEPLLHVTAPSRVAQGGSSFAMEPEEHAAALEEQSGAFDATGGYSVRGASVPPLTSTEQGGTLKEARPGQGQSGLLTDQQHVHVPGDRNGCEDRGAEGKSSGDHGQVQQQPRVSVTWGQIGNEDSRAEGGSSGGREQQQQQPRVSEPRVSEGRVSAFQSFADSLLSFAQQDDAAMAPLVLNRQHAAQPDGREQQQDELGGGAGIMAAPSYAALSDSFLSPARAPSPQLPISRPASLGRRDSGGPRSREAPSVGLPFMQRPGWPAEGGAPPSGPASTASDHHPRLTSAPQATGRALSGGKPQEREPAAPYQASGWSGALGRASGYAALSDGYLERNALQRSASSGGTAAAGSQQPAGSPPWSGSGRDVGPPQEAAQQPLRSFLPEGQRGGIDAESHSSTLITPSTAVSAVGRGAEREATGSHAGMAAGPTSDMPSNTPLDLFGPPPPPLPPVPQPQQEVQGQQGSAAFLKELSRDGPTSAGARRG